MVINIVNYIGLLFLWILNSVGNFCLFFFKSLKTFFTTKPKIIKSFFQMEQIGFNSTSIILLTGFSTGAVLALQSYIGFKRFGSEDLIGPLVALSMTRELGPVLTGLMVTGRCCSAMAAEIGAMRVSEQIDAITTLRINVFQYLIVPRILASTIILPFLTLFSMICGIIGGYIVCVYVLNLNGEQYKAGIRIYLELNDITGGLVKSSFFGLILSLVGTYKGFNTSGGARGIGTSTTQSVVLGSILILITNYFLASWLFEA